MKRFKEGLNTAIFTTRYVLQRQSDILYVYHYDDGSWQFSGKEELLEDEDYNIVSLAEILEIDSSLLELADLPRGFEAVRNAKGQVWQIISGN